MGENGSAKQHTTILISDLLVSASRTVEAESHRIGTFCCGSLFGGVAAEELAVDIFLIVADVSRVKLLQCTCFEL